MDLGAGSNRAREMEISAAQLPCHFKFHREPPSSVARYMFLINPGHLPVKFLFELLQVFAEMLLEIGQTRRSVVIRE